MVEYLLALTGLLILTIFFKYKYNIWDSKGERKITWLWVLTIGILGIAWDYLATLRRHWIFPGDGLIGLRIFTVPIEEFLFMFIVPYFALVIYKIYRNS